MSWFQSIVLDPVSALDDKSELNSSSRLTSYLSKRGWNQGFQRAIPIPLMSVSAGWDKSYNGTM